MKCALPKVLVLALFAMLGLSSPAQSVLGIGSPGIIGLPDTTHFGDTINGMSVWVVNRGALPVANLLVTLNGLTSTLSNPIQLGTLDLTGGILAPGDSTEVPLDYFVVSPQNSNNGANIMVIWPTAPGSSTGDSTDGPYWVDGTTLVQPSVGREEVRVYPNPATEHLNLDLPAGMDGKVEVILTDLEGRQVLRAEVTPGHNLDLPSCTSGMLIYRVMSDGHQIHAGKLRVENP